MSVCPECGSDNPFVVRGTCASDQYDMDPWHRDATHRKVVSNEP